MKVKGTFAHYNFNVRDLDASIAFYEKALDLHVQRPRTDHSRWSISPMDARRLRWN